MAKKGNYNNFLEELAKVQAAAETGMEKAVIQAQAETMARTHVDTGALRRSWTHDVTTENGVIKGVVGSNLEYAPYEDAYHPNISSAFQDNAQAYFNVIANEIKKAVK